MIDYQVFLTHLPGKVNEAVTPNEDGSYTVFIEETLSPTHQKKAFIHALRHIHGEDFYKDTVDEIEKQAHSWG